MLKKKDAETEGCCGKKKMMLRGKGAMLMKNTKDAERNKTIHAEKKIC